MSYIEVHTFVGLVTAERVKGFLAARRICNLKVFSQRLKGKKSVDIKVIGVHFVLCDAGHVF